MAMFSRVSLLLAALLGWTAPSLAAPPVIRVGVSGSAPFVISDANGLEGISVQIWEETASRLDRPFVYVPQPNSKANIEAVGKGDVDLAIGPISITPDRLANPKIDFTQPYFHGQEGLMIPVRPPSLWSRFSPFFGWAALSSLGGLMVLLFVVGRRKGKIRKEAIRGRCDVPPMASRGRERAPMYLVYIYIYIYTRYKYILYIYI